MCVCVELHAQVRKPRVCKRLPRDSLTWMYMCTTMTYFYDILTVCLTVLHTNSC